MALIWMLAGGCTAKPEYREPSLFAVTVSDLHYTSDPNVISSVVPAMPYAPQVTQALVNEVIALHPDVLIITGDNTNSGQKRDMEELAECLMQVKEAGIPVLMTTGNHDFNYGLVEEYREIYGPLAEPDGQDEASFSYYRDIGNVRIFVMDDSSYSSGAGGTFSEATMRWLKSGLKEAGREGLRVLFLSHHNVTAGRNDDRNDSYRITNRELEPLLIKNNVRLCISGHLHSQSILEHEGMYEIISGMVLSGRHPMGFLTMDETGVEYHTESIDFQTYGEAGLAAAIAETDRRSAEGMDDIFEKILLEKGVAAKERDGIQALLRRFMAAREEGSLMQERDAIRSDPYYEAMRDALADENYGPWIESLLDDPPRDGNHLLFAWD